MSAPAVRRMFPAGLESKFYISAHLEMGDVFENSHFLPSGSDDCNTQ